MKVLYVSTLETFWQMYARIYNEQMLKLTEVGKNIFLTREFRQICEL